MRWISLSRWPPVALLTALIVSTWTPQTMAQETSNPFTSRIDVRMGRQLFQARCTTCHGLNATGGDEGVGQLPPLRRLPRWQPPRSADWKCQSS